MYRSVIDVWLCPAFELDVAEGVAGSGFVGEGGVAGSWKGRNGFVMPAFLSAGLRCSRASRAG
jgi:hypothetical protein